MTGYPIRRSSKPLAGRYLSFAEREIVASRMPRRFSLDPICDIQVLCPMNRGRLGARALNADRQAALNGDQGKSAVSRFGRVFRVSDNVMRSPKLIAALRS